MQTTQSILAQFGKMKNFPRIPKKYIPGWIAINTKNKIVAHAKTFSEISDKVKGRTDIILSPATKTPFVGIASIWYP